jgi:hypothetical protein
MRRRLPLVRGPAAHTADTTGDTLGRRELVQWIGAVTAARVLPGCSSSSAPATMTGPKPPAPSFLSTKQQDALAALADYFVPPDHDPGGSALGVVPYVEQLMTALDGTAAKVFAGGPYSGRQPYANPDGTPSTHFPPDSFTTFVPLDRYRLAAWQLRLKGSDNVPGGGVNDAVLGKTIGWQTQVTAALDAAIAGIKISLDTSTPAADVKVAFESMPAAAKELITELVIEGCWSSPEYGGNKNLGGFKFANFEGDSQPLGYSLYDETTGSYKERPDAPVSTANPGPDPAPLDDATRTLITTLVEFAGGKVYF